MADRESVVVCKLGNIAFETAWNLQRQIQDRLVSAKRSSPREKVSHVVLLVEHPHVYTLGKSGSRSHLLSSEKDLAKSGASFIQIDRGGDITYHGPGQLVLYPILDLDYFYHDIHRYLRDLEEIVIRTCEEFGIAASRIPGRTGVWIDVDGDVDRKICAMGVRCSRWVTMHGIGFNLNTDLSRYVHIVPCGISDGDITSLANEVGCSVEESGVQEILLRHMADVFSADLMIYDRSEAEAFLRTYLQSEALPAF